jgi:hypothetical protein
MFTLTPTQGVLLMTGWLSVVLAVLLALRFGPRSRRLVPAYVTCPVLNRRVGAQLVRDEWTRGFCDVVRCDVLGAAAPVTCDRGCLARGRVAPMTRV